MQFPENAIRKLVEEKVKNPSEILGRMAPDVAKELNIDIDVFLDELWPLGYYHCPKCGKIVNIEEVGETLDEPCNKCRK
jgi:hypothetical protein